jgi:hypothetical protein
MSRTAAELARLQDTSLRGYRVPAACIIDQLRGSQVAPAAPGSPGVVALSAATPHALGVAAPGTSGVASDAGHIHAADASPGTPLREAIDDAVALLLTAGANISLSYSDVANTLTIAVTGALLASALSSATPADVGTAAAGTSASVSRADHVHGHGSQGGGTQHSAATTSVAGFLSAADKTKIDGVTAGAAVASVAGTAPIASSGGTTPAISIAAATTGAAGSMSAADKAKADAYPAISGLTTGAVLRATAAGAVAMGAVDLANASAVTGTLADARLSSNVALLSAANSFSSAQLFNWYLTIQTSDNAKNGVMQFQDSSPGQTRALAFNFLNGSGATFAQLMAQNDPTSTNQYIRIYIAGSERFKIDGNGRPYLFGVRAAPASPAAGEVYKDSSGFLKIG